MTTKGDIIFAAFVLGLVALMAAVGIKDRNDEKKPNYNTAYLEEIDITVDIDHYINRTDRYIIYGTDGSVYNVDEDDIILYNKKED